jgi:methylmalonyl-CoA/ethylmalonyl-CoA epimerase
MVSGIHHVGIVVRSLEHAYGFWRRGLGLPLVHEAEVADQGVRAALLAAGDAEVELLEPIGAETGVARFLTRRGEGLHHLCFETPDVRRALETLAGRGAALLDRTPRKGLAGQIAFVHPRACHGVLVELATPPARAPRPPSPLRLKRVVIGCADSHTAAQTFQRLFELPEVAINGGPRIMLGWAGGSALLMVPAGQAAGTEGLVALSMVAPELDAVQERLAAAATPMLCGASEITVAHESASGVHLHISRFHFP